MHNSDVPLVSPEKLVLETERLILRIPRRGDENALCRFYTENRSFLQPFSPTFSEELFSQRAWRVRIEATLGEYRSGKGLRLILIRKEAPANVIGVANFTSISAFPSFHCVLGYSIAHAFQGKGLMTEGLGRAIYYIFHDLRLHRIEANYMPRNISSGRVLEKLGFVIEGHAKEYLLINGKWEDHVRASLTSPNWPGL